MIVHAHLQPDHPAVVARRAMQARQALALQDAQEKWRHAAESMAKAAAEARVKMEAHAIAVAAAIEQRRANEILRTWRQAWKPAIPIIVATCERHGISLVDVVSKGRSLPLVACRQEAMARVAIETNLSLPSVGKIFRRHHATIIHAVRRWNHFHGKDVRGIGSTWRKASSYAYRGGV